MSESGNTVPREWWLHVVEERDALAAELQTAENDLAAQGVAMLQRNERIAHLEAALRDLGGAASQIAAATKSDDGKP